MVKPAARTAVVKPCCIGDIVMALPAIDALARVEPTGTIDVFTGAHSKSILQNRTSVGSVTTIDDVLTLKSVAPLALQLRRYFQVVVLDRSRLLKVATTLKRRTTTIDTKVDLQSRHESDIYRSVARRAGAFTEGLTYPTLEFTRAERRKAGEYASGLGGAFVALHPGGAENPGARMLQKRWPEEHYVQVIHELRNDGLRIVLTGGPDEHKLCESILQGAGSDSTFNASGKLTLMESAALVRHSALFIGADTGMSHLAAATGVPTIAIFGPTNPARYAPRGPLVQVLAPDASWEIQDADLRRDQPLDERVATTNIKVEQVLEASRRFLNSGKK